MAKYTEKLKLEIPDYDDDADIPKLTNKNNLIIEEEFLKRADNLSYDEEKNELQLSSNGELIGNPIEIIRSGGSVGVLNERSTSKINAYSCDYINNKIEGIGQVVNLFGDILGTNGTETLSLYAHIVATKIGTDIWKFDIEGQMDIANPTNNYEWGIMPSKISALLNAAIGKQVQFDESLRKQGNWDIIKSSNSLPYLDYYNYGTTFEYNSNQYLLFARYYTTDGKVGGYNTAGFEPSTHVYATIYLKEV